MNRISRVHDIFQNVGRFGWSKRQCVTIFRYIHEMLHETLRAITIVCYLCNQVYKFFTAHSATACIHKVGVNLTSTTYPHSAMFCRKIHTFPSCLHLYKKAEEVIAVWELISCKPVVEYKPFSEAIEFPADTIPSRLKLRLHSAHC